MIQSKFLKFIFYKVYHYYPTYAPYTEMLQLFNIKSLKSRRDISIFGFAYKIFHNSIDSSVLLSYFNIKVSSLITRNRNVLFHIDTLSTRSTEMSPIHSMSIITNKIIANNSTIDFFTDSLQQFINKFDSI